MSSSEGVEGKTLGNIPSNMFDSFRTCVSLESYSRCCLCFGMEGDGGKLIVKLTASAGSIGILLH